MKNDLVTLSASLKKLGLKKESLEIISILKKSQNLDTINPEHLNLDTINPERPAEYKLLIRDLSAYLRDMGGLLLGKLMSRLFSEKKSPVRITSDIDMLLSSLHQWYGSEDSEPIQNFFEAKIKDIKDGLELLKSNTDMSKTNVSMRLRSNYAGLSLKGISERVGTLMINLSLEIIEKTKSL